MVKLNVIFFIMAVLIAVLMIIGRIVDDLAYWDIADHVVIAISIVIAVFIIKKRS